MTLVALMSVVWAYVELILRPRPSRPARSGAASVAASWVSGHTTRSEWHDSSPQHSTGGTAGPVPRSEPRAASHAAEHGMDAPKALPRQQTSTGQRFYGYGIRHPTLGTYEFLGDATFAEGSTSPVTMLRDGSCALMALLTAPLLDLGGIATGRRSERTVGRMRQGAVRTAGLSSKQNPSRTCGPFLGSACGRAGVSDKVCGTPTSAFD